MIRWAVVALLAALVALIPGVGGLGQVLGLLQLPVGGVGVHLTLLV